MPGLVPGMLVSGYGNQVPQGGLAAGLTHLFAGVGKMADYASLIRPTVLGKRLP